MCTRFAVVWTACRLGGKFSVCLLLSTELLIIWYACGRPRLKLDRVVVIDVVP